MEPAHDPTPIDPHAHAMRELARLWTGAQPAVAAFISSLVPNFHDAEDVLQRVAVAVADKFAEYDPSRPFTAWAIGVARYEVLYRRRQFATDRHVFDSDAVVRIADAYESMADRFDDMKAALNGCMGEVAGRSRKILELRYRHELAPAQIAERLRMKPNAVYVALHRLRGSLRDCVERKLADVSPKRSRGEGAS